MRELGPLPQMGVKGHGIRDERRPKGTVVDAKVVITWSRRLADQYGPVCYTLFPGQEGFLADLSYCRPYYGQTRREQRFLTRVQDSAVKEER